MSSWHSYPSVFALGHKAIEELCLDPVLVEEKYDGSQISFGVFPELADSHPDGGLRIRSKGADLQVLAPEKMFSRGVEIIRSLVPQLHPGWTYRGEYLAKPKHNALAYDRVPIQHILLFDINTDEEQYLTYEEKFEEASRLGFETAQRLADGLVLSNPDVVRTFLEFPSSLGGQKIEGVVIKNYRRFGRDKKVLMGKFVSEAYKEVHAREWKSANLGQKDILERLIETYRTPARWAKAVQHLRERGLIEDSPRDIGLLFKEVPPDVQKECEEEIKDRLFEWAWPRLHRGIMAGCPEWYKEQLLSRQFSEEVLPAGR